ncbi:unnamed protein product [Adineta ricciae]|uniref:Peptidase C14 caspase domain-containing protein n=1 Tax=Adineta ricciae TaxID=249248 RepID=A0A814MCB8_ADIRI|nr:unnamed protein product [Adineta ricciae]
MASDAAAKPERRIACCIGNGSYSHQSNRLQQSANNANDLGTLFKTLGFDVTTIINGNRERLSQAIKTLTQNVKQGDLIIFYYCGQTYQVNGIDYLIHVDDEQLNSESDVASSALNTQEILNLLSETGKHFAIILVVDSSKIYQLGNARESKSKADVPSSRGIRKVNLPHETIVQFACDVDQMVNVITHNDRNTLYTKILLQYMAKQYVHVKDIFKYIENDVYQQTNRQQRPSSANRLSKGLQVFLNYGIVVPKLRIEEFLSDAKLADEEEAYYSECREYYKLTKEPLVCISDEVLASDSSYSCTTLKLAVDVNCYQLELGTFFDKFCETIGLPREFLTLKRVQKGSAILETEIADKSKPNGLKVKLKMIYKSLTEKMRQELAKIKIFFLFMGSVESLGKVQKFRSEIKMNPQYNRVYTQGRAFWAGPTPDRLDRGGNPYFCPVGWKRWSFYVTEKFYDKFKGWSICYHGTKFSYGLAILLSGLKPAERVALGQGIYTTPSINYACHPRYAEVKLIESSTNNTFFKSGKYVQFVLECRVHPSNIILKGPETLNATKFNTTIDNNISNDTIEWLINNQGLELVDFNDPNASIICTGIMVRVTDNHPALLPQSQWWHHAHLCDYSKCCMFAIDRKTLQALYEKGDQCNIMYD